MARTRDEALHTQRREEILLAAARLFKARGFHRSRTEDICTEAGISPGTLFRHFPDKQAIIMAIAEREFDGHKAEIELLATRSGLNHLARLTAEEFLALITPKGFDLGLDSWLELARDPAASQLLQTVHQQLREHLSQVLKRGQKEGWVRKPLDCEGAAALLLSLFGGLMIESELGVAPEAAPTARAMSGLIRSFILA